VLLQLDSLFFNEKRIFVFCFLHIADQQGLSKITTRFGKHMACPHEDQSVSWAASPWSHTRLIAAEIKIFTVACGINSYRGKVQPLRPSEMTVFEGILLVSSFQCFQKLMMISTLCS